MPCRAEATPNARHSQLTALLCCNGVYHLSVVSRWQQGAALDVIGAFFSDHEHAGVEVSGHQVWHNGGIYDAQAVNTLYLQLGVNNGFRPGAHGGRYRRDDGP